MASAISYHGDLTAWVAVKDMQRAIQWYGEHLGFKLLYQVDEMGWCEMETPVAKVSFGISQVEQPDVKGGTTLTFGVADIDTARRALESRGVRFDGETITIPGLTKLATFFDADGNKLMFSQSLQQH